MLSLSIVFIGGTYEASLGREPEWPPHPGRVFNALVAQAEAGSTEDDALRWLEALPPPAVLATTAKDSSLTGFVPTNSVSASKDTHQSYLGRTALPRDWHRSHPERAEAWMHWENATPEPGVLQDLARLCRRVPYLGRASSPVVLGLSAAAPPEDSAVLRWESPGDGSTRLRAPEQGSLAALRDAFDAGQVARSADRWHTYGRPAPVTPPIADVVGGPWPELLTFGFPKGQHLDGRQLVRVASAWRQAILAEVGRGHDPDALALLHGHHDGTQVQCAFLALPSVGWPKADGQIRGMGLALSPDLPTAVRNTVLKALGMDVDRPRLKPLYVPGLSGPLELSHGILDGRRTVDPRHWTATAGHPVWATVSPIVLDRFPRRRDDPADHLRRACAALGLPDPQEIEVLPGSPFEGAQRPRRHDLRRRPGDPVRPALHCRVDFGQPVRGPLVLGHLRHVGAGLLLPWRGTR